MERSRDSVAEQDGRQARAAAYQSRPEARQAVLNALPALPPLPAPPPGQLQDSAEARWQQSAQTFVAHVQAALAELAPRSSTGGPYSLSRARSAAAEHLSLLSDSASLSASQVHMQPPSSGTQNDSFGLPGASGTSSGTRTYQTFASDSNRQQQQPARPITALRSIEDPHHASAAPAVMYAPPEALLESIDAQSFHPGSQAAAPPPQASYVRTELDPVSGRMPVSSFVFDKPTDISNASAWGSQWQHGQATSFQTGTPNSKEAGAPGTEPGHAQGGGLLRQLSNGPGRQDASTVGKKGSPEEWKEATPAEKVAATREAKASKGDTVVDIRAETPLLVDKWKAYEASAAENPVLPFMPRKFFGLRWRILGRNPLAMRFGLWQYTLGEIIACVAIATQFLWMCIVWVGDIGGMRSDVGTTGAVAAFMLMLVYFTAMHANGVLLLLLGLPFERALPWHKALAWSATIQGLIHGCAHYVNGRRIDSSSAGGQHFAFDWWTYSTGMEITGWIISGAMLVLITTAMSWMKTKHFAAFYRIHVIFAALTTGATLLHGFGTAYSAGVMPISLPGAAIWMLDLLLRWLFMNRLTTGTSASIRCLFPPGKNEAANAIVELGLLHWHPFTISSETADDELTLHIGAGGNWTTDLAELAKKQRHVKAYIEGPYGSPKIDYQSDKYKCFLIVGSGLGWTFSRAMKRQLLRDATRGRPIKAIRSIAIVRELAASALKSCWGWDLREDDGETWPKNLHALEEVYLTGKQPPKEETVFQAASCGIKPGWGSTGALTHEGSAALSRGVSVFVGSQAELSLRSPSAALGAPGTPPDRPSSPYVPPMRAGMTQEMRQSSLLSTTHRMPSRPALTAATGALGEPDTVSVLQPWDVSDQLAAALTQRSRGNLSRSLHNIAELAVAMEDETQARSSPRKLSPHRAGTFTKRTTSPTTEEHPQRSRSTGRLRAKGVYTTSGRSSPSHRVRWDENEHANGPIRSLEKRRSGKKGGGVPVGESGRGKPDAPDMILPDGSPRTMPPRLDIAAQPLGRRSFDPTAAPFHPQSSPRAGGPRSEYRDAFDRSAAGTRISHPAPSWRAADNSSLDSRQVAARSNATANANLRTANLPPPNASVLPLAHHRSYPKHGDGTFVSLRELHSAPSGSAPRLEAKSAQANVNAAHAASVAQATPFASDPTFSANEMSYNVYSMSPPPQQLSPPRPLSDGLRDGPAEMLLEQGVPYAPQPARVAPVRTAPPRVETQRPFLSSQPASQQPADSSPHAASPRAAYGALPRAMTSMTEHPDSDWPEASAPLSSEPGESRRSSASHMFASVPRGPPGVLSSVESPQKTTSSTLPQVMHGVPAAVLPSSNVFSSMTSGPLPERAEPPPLRAPSPPRQPYSPPPVAKHASIPTRAQPAAKRPALPGRTSLGGNNTMTSRASSMAGGGSSFMAPLMNWTRARAHNSHGISPFFGNHHTHHAGPRDAEWGEADDLETEDTPSQASREESQPWLLPAHMSPVDNERSPLVKSLQPTTPGTAGQLSLSRTVRMRLGHEHGTDGGSDAVRFRRRRPDFGAIFDAAAAEAKRLGEDRVAVLVCGNEGVLKRCLKQCALGREVRFDCHYEAFSFG